MTALDYNGHVPTRPTTAQTITADRMEALAFQWGAQIELHGDLAYLTHDGQQYVAVLDGWVA